MIDDIDIQLISELRSDGRKTSAALASKLNVSEGTIRRRLKVLMNNGILRVIGVANFRALGYRFVNIIGIRVKIPDMRLVAEELARIDYVVFVARVSGRYDLMVVILTQEPEELLTILENKASGLSGIISFETFICQEIHKGTSGFFETFPLVDYIRTLI